MRRSLLLVPSLAVIAALTSACQTTSVVRTTKVGEGDTPVGRPYLVYPMATTMLVVTVKKAGGGGDDKKDKTDPTNANTITIQNWVGGQKPEDDKKDTAEKAPCDAVRDAYKAQQKARGKLLSQYIKRRETVLTLWGGDEDHAGKLLSEDKDQQVVLDSLAEQEKAAAADEESLKTVVALRKNFDDLECKVAVSIDVSQKIVADSGQMVALYLNDSAYSADKLNIKLDANGFPSSITSTADDKSGEVVTAALKSIANVVALAQGAPDISGLSSMKAVSLGGLVKSNSSNLIAKNLPKLKGLFPEMTVIKATPEVVDQAFRLQYGAAVRALLAKRPDTLPALDPPLPESPTLLLVEDFSDAPTSPTPPTAPTPAPSTPRAPATPAPAKPWKYGAIYGAYGYRVACAPVTETPPTVAAKATAFSMPEDPTPGQPGLIVSGQRACEIDIIRAKNWKTDDPIPDFRSLVVDVTDRTKAMADVVSRNFFLATDPRMQQVVPINRTSLIARADGYEFTDGRMTSLSYDKPSNALAVVSLPFKAIGDVISGFSTAVQGQQGLIKAQSDLVSAKAGQTKADAEVYNAKAALLKAQTDLLAAQAAADKARKDQAAAAAQP